MLNSLLLVEKLIRCQMSHKNIPGKPLIIGVSTKSKSLIHVYLVRDMQDPRVFDEIFGPKLITLYHWLDFRVIIVL